MLRNPTNVVQSGARAEPIPPWICAIGLAFVVSIAYFFTVRLSVVLIDESDGVALFWPAVGISSGILIARGRAARLPVFSGVIVATAIANLMGDRNVWSAATFALWNAGEALLAAWLLERYFGPSFALDRLRNVLGLLAAAVVAAAASAIGGTASLELFETPIAPMWTIWQHWFVSDAVGIFTVAPLLIGLAGATRDAPPRNEVIEGFTALVALALMTVIVVLLPPGQRETVIPVALLSPVLLWITARCQPVFAAAAAFVVSSTIILSVTFGIGSFRSAANPISDRVVSTQGAILVFALGAYILAALFAERRRHVAMLVESEARLQEALTAGAVTAFEWDLCSGQSQRSENAGQILGFSPELSLPFIDRVHPDDREPFKAFVHRICVESPSYSTTFRFIRPDGREVWLEETARGEFDADGRLLRLKGLTRDITQRRHAEEHQDMLLAELDHRVKNVLARVAAIMMQTRQRCETIEEFITALHGRIQSMATAHALLSRSRWRDVGLTDLVRKQLAPYTSDANTTISGPDIMLTSAETQALAMVIHELVTNAAKHGALSRSDGSVSVNWDCNGIDTSAVLTVKWRELGGPPITAPVRFGYGGSLIRDLIPYQLDGTVDLTFPSDGACCKIEIPLERLAKIRSEVALKSAVMDGDAFSTGVRKFFRGLRITAQREIEKAVHDVDAMRTMTATTMPIKAVVMVSGIGVKFEVDGDIELAG